MYGSAGRTASYNTAFTKLAKMNVVRTLRECPGRYLKPLGLKMGVLGGSVVL